MKTGVPMITIRTVRANLNKEALGKIKNPSKKWPKRLSITFEIQPVNPEAKTNQSIKKRRKTELWYANINI